jgi:hypothetical protein
VGYSRLMARGGPILAESTGRIQMEMPQSVGGGAGQRLGAEWSWIVRVRPRNRNKWAGTSKYQ